MYVYQLDRKKKTANRRHAVGTNNGMSFLIYPHVVNGNATGLKRQYKVGDFSSTSFINLNSSQWDVKVFFLLNCVTKDN